MKVPLDYDNPGGDSIDMALIKYPASEDRIGAVLFNPGGPGASGFDPIAFSGSSIAQGLGITSLDLIGFDPRGVDRSGGLHCVSDEFEDQHLYIDDTPNTPEEQALKDEANTGFIDGCKQKYGDTLRFYSTANTARDMDAIRAALGDDQISVMGLSYGTYLGATYARMFPDRVRAMVLDSVVEPNGDTVQQAFENRAPRRCRASGDDRRPDRHADRDWNQRPAASQPPLEDVIIAKSETRPSPDFSKA